MNLFYKKKCPIILLTLLLFFSKTCIAQDYRWWNAKHNWDGVTSWKDYIITKPKYMGPNALPVPDIKNGTISKKAYFQISLEKHTSSGDKTENLYTALFIPLYSHRVGLNINIIPFEHYKTDTITRDIRFARNITGEGFAVGDFYIGTFIQLIENNENLPDVLLTVNLKTASGSKMSDARYTDTPGYFFDLSFGKKFCLNKQKMHFIKPGAMIGFYSWQNQGNGQQQNDAFLYGLGIDFIFQKFDITNSIGGYIGYLGNGDKPVVYRTLLRNKSNKIFNYELKFQLGLHDYQYTSLRLSCIIDVTKLLKNH